MPHVINGIGTWYYGKRRVQARMDTCEFCSRYTELKSYDTTLYVVVVFIPLIPLGEKRVINQCSLCHKHRVSKLSEFEKARQLAISDAARAYKEKPDDPTLLTKALQVMLVYQDRENFMLLAPAAAKRFAESAAVLCAAANGWYYFGDFEKAAECWARALALRADDAVRRNLARAYCKLERPMDARPLVEHILSGHKREELGLLYFVVEVFAATANHASALQLLQDIAQTFPDVVKDRKGFKKYRRASERGMKTGKPVKSALLKKAKQPGAHSGLLGWKLARIIGPVLALIGVCIYLGMAWQRGRAASVYVVNGLDHPYRVEVDGQVLRLPPHRPLEIHLAEGSVAIRFLDAGLPSGVQRVEWHTPFWLRPVDNSLVVINPDRAALLARAETVYRAEGKSGPAAGRDVMLGGRLFYRLSDIDYPFGEFPTQLSVDRSASSTVKRRVFVYRPASVYDGYSTIREFGSPEDRRAYLEALLAARPDNREALALLSTEFGASNALARLRASLDAKPLRINWHRAYQSLAKATSPKSELETEYRRRLVAEPENAMLKYLLGRVVTNRTEADALFLASEQGPQPIGYGYNALAYHYFIKGDFTNALVYTDKSKNIVPAEESLRNDVLLACRCYDQLYAQAEKDFRAHPNKYNAALECACLLQLLGRTNEINAVVEKYRHGISTDTSPAEQKRIISRLRASLAYLGGDDSVYLASITETPKFLSWYTAVVQGHADAAADAVAKTMTNAAAAVHALVYAMARRESNKALAETELQKLIVGLHDSDDASRQAADWLAGKSHPTPEDFLELKMLPSEKVYVLLALGWHDPSLRDTAFTLGRTLNFDPAFPHRQLAALLDGPSGLEQGIGR